MESDKHASFVYEALRSGDAREILHLIDLLPDEVICFTVEEGLPLLYANETAYALFGYPNMSRHGAERVLLTAHIHPDDRAHVLERIKAATRHNPVSTFFRLRAKARSGEYIDLGARVAFMKKEGQTVGIATAMDFSPYVQLEEALKQTRKAMRGADEDPQEKPAPKPDALYQSALACYGVNITKDALEQVSGCWSELLLDGHDVPQCTLTRALTVFTEHFLPREDRQSFIDTFRRENVLAASQRGVNTLTLEHRCLLPSGILLWGRSVLSLIREPYTGDLRGMYCCHDISSRRERESMLIYNSDHDSLTGLYNRRAGESLINDYLQSEEDAGGLNVFVVLDIDNFKTINDSRGHLYGDEYLRAVADTLSAHLRASDIAMRLGGDEFVLMLKGLREEAHIRRKLAEINEAIHSLPLRGDDRRGNVGSASMGTAIAPKDGADFMTLYNRADSALYYVKRNNKDGLAFFGDLREEQL